MLSPVLQYKPQQKCTLTSKGQKGWGPFFKKIILFSNHPNLPRNSLSKAIFQSTKQAHFKLPGVNVFLSPFVLAAGFLAGREPLARFGGDSPLSDSSPELNTTGSVGQNKNDSSL